MSNTTRTLGVIGGSGLYELEQLADIQEVALTTPFGPPSDSIISGVLGNTRLLFLPRHGRGHRLPPHRINYRANVLALKMAGAEQVLSVSAVGSMREGIHPGDMVVVDHCTPETIGDVLSRGLWAGVTVSPIKSAIEDVRKITNNHPESLERIMLNTDSGSIFYEDLHELYRSGDLDGEIKKRICRENALCFFGL